MEQLLQFVAGGGEIDADDSSFISVVTKLAKGTGEHAVETQDWFTLPPDSWCIYTCKTKHEPGNNFSVVGPTPSVPRIFIALDGGVSEEDLVNVTTMRYSGTFRVRGYSDIFMQRRAFLESDSHTRTLIQAAAEEKLGLNYEGTYDYVTPLTQLPYSPVMRIPSKKAGLHIREPARFYEEPESSDTRDHKVWPTTFQKKPKTSPLTEVLWKLGPLLREKTASESSGDAVARILRGTQRIVREKEKEEFRRIVEEGEREEEEIRQPRAKLAAAKATCIPQPDPIPATTFTLEENMWCVYKAWKPCCGGSDKKLIFIARRTPGFLKGARAHGNPQVHIMEFPGTFTTTHVDVKHGGRITLVPDNRTQYRLEELLKARDIIGEEEAYGLYTPPLATEWSPISGFESGKPVLRSPWMYVEKKCRESVEELQATMKFLKTQLEKQLVIAMEEEETEEEVGAASVTYCPPY